jgi:hypothetical protein
MNRVEKPGFDGECSKEAARTEKVAYLVNM